MYEKEPGKKDFIVKGFCQDTTVRHWPRVTEPSRSLNPSLCNRYQGLSYKGTENRSAMRSGPQMDSTIN